MIVVPLDKALPENEIESSIIRSEAEAIIFDKKHLDIINKMKKDKSSNLKHFICMDFQEDNDDILSYSSLIKRGTILLKNGDNRYDEIKIDNTNMGIMLFTSRYHFYIKNCYVIT